MARVLQSLSSNTRCGQRSIQSRGYASDARVSSVKVTRLPSGVRVATNEKPGELATVGVWIDAGSFNENDDNNGVSNFIAHLGFNSDTKQKARKIGASLSSYTSRQLTAFVSQSLTKDVSTSVNLLADTVQKTNFSSSEIDHTRETILKDIHEYKKDMDLVQYDYIHSTAFQKSTLAYSPLGETKSIRNINSEHISNFVKQNYTSNNIIVAASGHVKHEELVSLVDKSFTSIPQTEKKEVYLLGHIDYVGSEMRIRDDTIPYIHAIVGWESVGWNHPQFYNFLVLQQIFGSFSRDAGAGGQQLSARLAEKFAHGHSFVPYGNSYEAFLSTFKEIGLFGIHFIAPDKLIHDCVYAIYNEIQRLVTYVTKDEVERAKSRAKTALLFPLEDPKLLLRDASRQIFTENRYLDRNQLIQKIDEVNVNTLHKMLNTFFFDVDPVCVSQGPNNEEFPDYNVMRSWTYWNRW